MWVRNISKLSKPFYKGETVIVLKAGCCADVDLPADANLKKLELEVLNLKPVENVVVGEKAAIKETGGKKGKRRNGN